MKTEEDVNTVVLMHHGVPMNGFSEGTKFHRLEGSHVPASTI